MSLEWVKAIKISCWYCGCDMGVIILQKDVTSNHSKLYGIHHVCQKCLNRSSEINDKVRPIMKVEGS